jgi:hypothetical protein
MSALDELSLQLADPAAARSHPKSATKSATKAADAATRDPKLPGLQQ